MYSTQSGDYMHRYTFSDPVYLRAIMEWKKKIPLKLCPSSLLWLEVNGLNAQNWDLLRVNEVPVHKVWSRAFSQFPNMYTERVEAFEKLTYAEDKGQCMKESFYCRSFYDQVVIRFELALPDFYVKVTIRMQLLKLLPFISQLAALILK